jgi:glucose-1-phosphate thymidylyltransferase
MLSGIRDILIITTPHDLANFQRLLDDGSSWGLNIEYIVQPSPDGLAQAFILGEDFLQGHPSTLVLGDNIYYGHGFYDLLQHASSQERGATVFGYRVDHPEAYGVAEFDENNKVISLEEKPENPKSHYAVTGLYFYDENVVEMAKQVRPSKRGELEITDLNMLYLKEGLLNVEIMGRGFTWLDTGTHDNLLAASQFVQTIEKRQGLKIGSPAEVAYQMGFIGDEQLAIIAQSLSKTDYGKYLVDVLNDPARKSGELLARAKFK